MKKLSIIFLTLATTLTIYGCAKADIEKNPVLIEGPFQNEIGPEIGNETGNAIGNQSETESTEDKNSSNEPFELTISLEGMEETFQAKYHNSKLGYRIAYDIERFTVTEEKDSDSFIAQNPNPEIYPYVLINISRTLNTTKENSKTMILESLSEQYNDIRVEEKIRIGEYDGIQVSILTGNDWNSAIRNFYLVETNSSVYVIETQYFVEAAEGFGARIKAMLDTIEITE